LKIGRLKVSLLKGETFIPEKNKSKNWFEKRNGIENLSFNTHQKNCFL
jgi:hypothetical protein